MGDYYCLVLSTIPTSATCWYDFQEQLPLLYLPVLLAGTMFSSSCYTYQCYLKVPCLVVSSTLLVGALFSSFYYTYLCWYYVWYQLYQPALAICTKFSSNYYTYLCYLLVLCLVVSTIPTSVTCLVQQQIVYLPLHHIARQYPLQQQMSLYGSSQVVYSAKTEYEYAVLCTTVSNSCSR